jgi:hypothetical protein
MREINSAAGPVQLIWITAAQGESSQEESETGSHPLQP